MAQFTMVFTTRHRDEDEVEKDCMLICECIVDYTNNFKYIYNGKGFIILHIYDVRIEDEYKLITKILDKLYCNTQYKSLNLRTFSKY